MTKVLGVTKIQKTQNFIKIGQSRNFREQQCSRNTDKQTFFTRFSLHSAISLSLQSYIQEISNLKTVIINGWQENEDHHFYSRSHFLV